MKYASLLLAIAFAAAALLACNKRGSPQAHENDHHDSATKVALEPVVLSIVATNDIHGALERLPILAGHVANLRAVRKHDGGVLLIDAGDMFQGSLESNINEGAAVVDGFNAIGYSAAVVGNHEFDFGPVGPAATPQGTDGDAADPRGALKARLAQAEFPILAANYLDEATGERVSWNNAPAAIVLEVAGVQVGIIGVSTIATRETTMAANVVGLRMAPLAETIEREARALRGQGAQVIIVTAHAGGGCETFENPDDISSCTPGDEIMAVAGALPANLVDVIVAGHTHRAMAHRVNGIVITESYTKLRAFGRVDVRVTPATAATGTAPAQAERVEVVAIHPPHELCTADKHAPVSACKPGDYEGAPVIADQRVADAIAPALAAAAARKQAPLGVDIGTSVTGVYMKESSLGNLFADLLRQGQGADVGLMNAGGLRADLTPGPLTYGELYEAMPFDNRFAVVEMKASDLANMLAQNLGHEAGFLSVSGVRARAACRSGAVAVELLDERGARIEPTRRLRVATSDFLATSEKGPIGRLGLPAGAVQIQDGDTIRDVMARLLSERGGTLSGDSTLLDAKNPRVAYQGERPMRCAL